VPFVKEVAKFLGDLGELWDLVDKIAAQALAAAPKIVQAVLDNTTGFINNVIADISKGFTEFFGRGNLPQLLQAGVKWLFETFDATGLPALPQKL